MIVLALTTFQRKEMKFLISEEQMNLLLKEIGNEFVYDEFCKNGTWYLIRNIYLDTEENQLIHLSIMKPTYKEKIRIRKYGYYNDQKDVYFLEMKKKAQGIVFKRRILFSKEELETFLKTKKVLTSHNAFSKQVMNEFIYLFQQHELLPKLFLTYERLALKGKNDPTLRMTFDRNILTRRADFDFDKEGGESLLKEHQIIMEIKFENAMPLWLAHLLATHHIYKTSFSKYGQEYQKYVLEKRSCRI